MFQIETALLKFSGDGDKSTEHVSIVKRSVFRDFFLSFGDTLFI